MTWTMRRTATTRRPGRKSGCAGSDASPAIRGRNPRRETEEEDPATERAAMTIVEKFRAAGADIDMERYKKRAEKPWVLKESGKAQIE
jgi:hypothetical protein